MPNHVSNYAFVKYQKDSRDVVEVYNSYKLALITSIILSKKEYNEKDLKLIDYLKSSHNEDFVEYTEDSVVSIIQEAFNSIDSKTLNLLLKPFYNAELSGKNEVDANIKTAFDKKQVSVFSNDYLFSYPLSVLVHYIYNIDLNNIGVPSPCEFNLNFYTSNRIGTKWGVYDVEMMENEIYFNTAWSPLSDAGVARMSEMLSKVNIELTSIVFIEFGMGFCGETVIVNDKNGYQVSTSNEDMNNILWVDEDDLSEFFSSDKYEKVDGSNSLYVLNGALVPEAIQKISYLM